jgi:hypothetical protein
MLQAGLLPSLPDGRWRAGDGRHRCRAERCRKSTAWWPLEQLLQRPAARFTAGSGDEELPTKVDAPWLGGKALRVLRGDRPTDERGRDVHRVERGATRTRSHAAKKEVLIVPH